MKRLLVLRHAKSSRAHPGQQDHDRPLNGRGRGAALVMGAEMAKASLLPEIILSSDSRRTRETVALWCESADWSDTPRFRPELYLASAAALVDAARSAPDTTEIVMLVAHNPGIEDLVSRVAREEIAMPTGSLAILDIQCDSWNEVDLAAMELAGLKRPDQLRG